MTEHDDDRLEAQPAGLGEIVNGPISRRQLLRRAALGGAALSTPALLAACGGDGDGDEGGGEASGGGGGGGGQAEAKKVAIVYDIGGKGDLSFNDAAYRGLQAAKQDLGDQIEVADPSVNNEGSNRKEVVDGLVSDGYGLVIGVGFLFSEDIAKSAQESPDARFGIVDGFVDACTKPDTNVRCLGFKEHEGSFLVGAAAALKTKKNIVGFVGGQKGPLIERFQAGYEAGVQHVAKEQGKDIKVLVDYAGVDAKAFQNPAKGRELATKQIGQGADVIYHASGLTGNGVIAAAAERKVYAIGVDSDQSLTAKPNERPWILTSMLKRVDTSVEKTIKDYAAGKFSSGVEALGLKEDGVGYALDEHNRALITPEMEQKLEQAKADIIAGKLQVQDYYSTQKK